MGISSRDYDQMLRRLAKPSGSKSALSPEVKQVAQHTILLGIDPSLRGTGFGIIHRQGDQYTAKEHGMVACPPSWPLTRCLAQIHQVIKEVIERHQPTVCAVEGLFYAQNSRVARIMGEARGAAMVAAATAGLPIYELAPRKVKQAIVGYGNAGKEDVAKMVERMLGLDQTPQFDAADAMAVALAFSLETQRPIGPQPKQI
jgi:crossover junction endodeoxyribonuclease RuvC